MQINPIDLKRKISLLSKSEVEKLYQGLTYTTIHFPQAVMIGGCSVVTYTKSNDRLLTPDLDFLVDTDVVKHQLETDNINHQLLLDSKENIIGITINGFTDYLDINTGNLQLNRIIITEYNTVTINDCNVGIIKPELLVILKLELSRNKDVEDALLLLQSGSMDKNLYLKYLKDLQPTLTDYESLNSYSEMIV